MRALIRKVLVGGTALSALFALLFAPPFAPLFAQVKDYREIKAPPLRSFSMPQPKRIELANGMVIFLQSDRELPLIRGSARIRGGERDVPASKAGLFAIYGGSWRTGGTESKTGDQLDDLLESRAARIETSGGVDATTIALDVLKGDFETVFPIFMELLQKPAFRQEKIDLAKTQARTGISRRNDEPGSIVIREAGKLGYGPQSPYARHPEYETITAITRDDLLAFHKQYVHPNNMILGFVGDFDAAAMEKKLRDAFGSWKKGPQAPPPSTAGTPSKAGVYFIGKEDVNQSNIAMVHPGAPTRSDPDFYAITVMNEILSGGFSGRLMNEIRSRLGLAYGVGGGIISEWDHPGLVRVQMATKSGSTLQAVDALRNELRKLHTQAFTADELSLSKEGILNAFVFTMDSKAKLLSQRVLLEFYGYPADFWQKYKEGIEKVTAEDVARVAKKYVQPDRVAILVVGNEKEFDKPMGSLGTVTPIDITIPEPGAAPRPAAGAAPAAPAAPAASSAEGMALLRKVQDFAGGKAKIDAVQSVRTQFTITAKTPQGEMEIESDRTDRLPDTRREVMKTPMGEMTSVITPTAGFMASPMGTQDLPASQRDSTVGEMKFELLNVLRNAGKQTVSVAGTEKVGDVNAQILQIDIDGSSMKWWVDPATGRLLRTSKQGRMGEQVTDLTEWKQFGGINFPTSFSVTVGGQPRASLKVTSIEVNPTIDAKLFEKPPAK